MTETSPVALLIHDAPPAAAPAGGSAAARGNAADRLLSFRQLQAILPISSMTCWRWCRDPESGFPQPVKLGGRNFWSETELRAFIADKRVVRNAA